MLIDFTGSFEQFAELAKRIATAAFTPDDDTPPTLVSEVPGGGAVTVLELPDGWFSSGAAKVALGRHALTPMAYAGSRRIALVSEAWLADGDTPAGREIARLHEEGEPIPAFCDLGLDGIRELLIAWVAAPGESGTWQAEIVRTTTQAKVGTWVFVPGGESHWFDALQAGWQAGGHA